MLSTLNWTFIGCLLTVLFKSANFATLPDSNSLSISEEDVKAGYPEISLKLSKDSSSGDDYETTQLCKSVKKHINPNDLARERGYDVEDSPSFSQTIEVDVCENVGLPCSHIYPYKKTMCRQKYIKFQLRVTTKDKMNSLEDFEIPSVCECVFLYSKLKLLGSL